MKGDSPSATGCYDQRMNELLGLPYSPWSEKARWAEARKVPDAAGEGPVLSPKEHDAVVEHWIEVGERALNAGRVLSLHRTLEDPRCGTERELYAAQNNSGPQRPSE